MPTSEQKRRVNYYGIFAFWSSLLLVASYFVLYTSGCEQMVSVEIQLILLVAFITGLIVFLFGFCNLAIRLYHRKFFFYLIVLCLLVVSGASLYVSYATLSNQCVLGLYYERNLSQLQNVTSKIEQFRKTFQSLHNRRNDHYTVSAVLDIVAAAFFTGSAYAFRNRF